MLMLVMVVNGAIEGVVLAVCPGPHRWGGFHLLGQGAPVCGLITCLLVVGRFCRDEDVVAGNARDVFPAFRQGGRQMSQAI